jgi:hypothetical protein
MRRKMKRRKGTQPFQIPKSQMNLPLIVDLLFPYLELADYASLEAATDVTIEYNWRTALLRRLPAELDVPGTEAFPVALWSKITNKYGRYDDTTSAKKYLLGLLESCIGPKSPHLVNIREATKLSYSAPNQYDDDEYATDDFNADAQIIHQIR